MEPNSILAVVLHELELLERSDINAIRTFDSTPKAIEIEMGQTDSSSHPHRSVKISTSGIESFFLTLDEKFQWQDFNWEESGQAEILMTMIRLTVSYLDGHGREEKVKKFLRERSVFVLELDGSPYYFNHLR
jgi:hypothetical protein